MPEITKVVNYSNLQVGDTVYILPHDACPNPTGIVTEIVDGVPIIVCDLPSCRKKGVIIDTRLPPPHRS